MMSDQQNNPARPAEIESLSNRILIHPLSDWLAPFLARMGVHPNLVSMTGLACGALAAWIYAQAGDWTYAVAALACMLAWHIMDGADGQVARLTGKASPTGRVIDGVADYSVFILVYIALVLTSDPEYRVWAWIAGWIAGPSHLVQAALYELQREKYIAWTNAEGPLPQGHTPQGEVWRDGTFWWLEWGYVRIQRMIGGDGIIVPGRDGAPAPDVRREIASRYRAHYATHVHRWGVLSANSHTLAIFIFVLAGWPIGYFLFEAVAMNLALILLLAKTRKLDRSFTAGLQAK